jgi:hypothetical protein
MATSLALYRIDYVRLAEEAIAIRKSPDCCFLADQEA